MAMTLTFGECAENHVGNQQLGEIGEAGFSVEDMHCAKNSFERLGCPTQMVELGRGATVLLARNGLNAFGVEADALFAEHDALDPDRKALMYKRVVNKKARHNLCYDEAAQVAQYEAGKGTVVAFSSVPLLQAIRTNLPRVLGTEKAAALKCELNKYYEPQSCGIGFHGDSERKIVVAVRLGVAIPLHFQWFERHKPIGERYVISLQHGDMYLMSEKATGHDWKRSSIPTLRHAAGCAAFTTIKRQSQRPVLKRFGFNTELGAASAPTAKRSRVSRDADSEPDLVSAAVTVLREGSRVEPLLKHLQLLRDFEMDLPTLSRTGVALVIKGLRDHDHAEIAALSNELYSRWKKVARAQMQ